MHEPIKTSCISVFSTAERGLISSGSFGQASRGSLISFKSISMISAYSAFASGSKSSGFNIHSSIACALLSSVLASP